MQIPESIVTDFSNVRTRNKENIKTGWGTDIQYTHGDISDANRNGNRKIILASRFYIIIKTIKNTFYLQFV